MDDIDKLTFQNLVNAGLHERITGQIQAQNIALENKLISDLVVNRSLEEANQSKEDVVFWRDSANYARRKVKNLEEQVEFYKNLLAKPMIEIASKNESFKETYRNQQEFLANFMVSQKAFKELAIDFGIQLGKTKDEVIQKGIENKVIVLNNKTKYDNNVEGSDIITPHLEALKDKLQKT